MELKHLVKQFSYRIEPKPEGGFIARATDPTVPLLEAPTREELQQKIQSNLATALAAAFPGLKLPLEKMQIKYDVRIERKPGGGFAVHSTSPDAKEATHEEIDHFAEELIGFVGKQFPQPSEALAARGDSGVAKIFANQKTSVTVNADSHKLALGIAQGLPQAESIQPNYANVEDVELRDARTINANFNNVRNAIANSPITPETSSSWPIFRFLLALLIIAALMYLFLHHS
jgi:hypothetical protein